MKKTNLFYTTFLVSFLLVGAGIAQAVSLPDFSQTNDLPGFISSIYSFALTVVGIAVFIRILYAGFLMLTAGGNASKWNDAKTKMTNAIVGAILLFAAYLILFVINPDLVKNTFNFSLPPSSQAPGGPSASQHTSPTSGPAQITGRVSGDSAFLDEFISSARAAGIYSFDLRVVDADGNACVQTYTIETVALMGLGPERTMTAVKKFDFLSISAAEAADDCSIVSLAPVVIPQAIEGRDFYIEIPAYGGRMPYVYSIVDGELPPGLSLVADAPKAAYIGSAPLGSSSTTNKDGVVTTLLPASPTRTPALTATPTPRPPSTTGFCATRVSTCPSSGYTWIEGAYGCLSNTNDGNICASDSHCVEQGLGSSARCFAVSSGGCACTAPPGASLLGPCCQPYSSLGLATQETANILASCLGATVVESPVSSWVFMHPADLKVYSLHFPGGATLNAGAVANTYMRNTKAYADDIIATEACR